MALLLAGLLLWSLAHLFKRLAPGPRARLGDAAKVGVALAVLASVVMMVYGYQAAGGAFFWGRNPALVGINNLLMLVAAYLLVASVAKVWITGRIRHPQLTAVKAWALAHLLVNGDVPSFILFGGLLAWAVVEVILINKQDGKPPLSVQTTPLREVVAGVVTILLFGAMAFAHIHWGYPVFG